MLKSRNSQIVFREDVFCHEEHEGGIPMIASFASFTIS